MASMVLALHKEIFMDTQAETRSFKLHPEILFSIIQKQSGTIDKALLELVIQLCDRPRR